MNDNSLFTDQPAPSNDSLFTDESAPKSLSGFGSNLVDDVKGNVKGLGDLAVGLATNPIDTVKNVPGALMNEGKRIGLGELLTGHPINAAKKLGNAAYDKPLSTVMDVAPVVGAAGKALGLGGAATEGVEAAADAGKAAEMASDAGKAGKVMPPAAEGGGGLHILEPGAKAGEPHALFAYNDNFGPEGTPRSVYNIYGDPNSPAIKQRGWGSSVPKEDLDTSGIPIVGRQPGSMKFEPLDELKESAAEAPPPSPKSTIGQRLAARTTSQALDINPLAARKLATKAGMSPEATILDLGNKANELIPNLIEPMDSANSKFGKILDAHDAAGKEIGKIVDNATKGTKGAFPEANETIGALRNAAQNYYQVDGGDLALQKTADRLEGLQKAGKLDFDRLTQVKSAIGKGFNKAEAPPGTEEIYGILNDGIDKVINRLSTENPSLGDNFSKLKQVYTITSKLLPAMSRTAAKEVAGSSVGGGIFSKMLPSAIGGAIGGVPGAILGGGAKYLQEAIAPDLGKNLAYMAMKASPEMIAKIRKAFPNIPQAAAASIAARLTQNNSRPGMAHGGMVPDEVRKYVGC